MSETEGPRRDDEEQPDYAPLEPEPEGGPAERARQFLEERLTPLRPKGEEGPARAAPRTEDESPQPAAPDRGPGAELPPLPEDFRERRLQEYRSRLREHASEPSPPPAAPGRRDEESEGEAEDADPQPPLPPAPPPANNWVPIGPSVLRQGQAEVKPATSGRTPGIAVDATGNRVYAATANGGVWRSDDAGRTWRSTMDAFDLNQPNAGSDSLACGAIALHPTNPNRVYVGTGEGAGGAYFGVGPVVSNDGGATWATEPVAAGSQQLAGTAFYALAVDPGNPDRVVAGTRRGIYRREPAGGGAFRWAQKQLGGVITWVPSVVVARAGSTTTFYAANWGGPVFRSTNGQTWTAVGTGFPTANVGRIGLAVRATDPTVVYALVAATDASVLGVWRLSTANGTWRQVTGHPANLFGPVPGGPFQGWYDLAIVVDPNNANRIYLGGSTVFTGSDWSGALFRCDVTVTGTTATMTPTYIGASTHADIHALVFRPGDSNRLWVGCDGGVFHSTNPTGTGNVFEPRNTGLQTLLMNSLGQHPTEDAVVFGGTQDNGGVRFTGEEAWLYSSGGDAGSAIVNWTDPYRVLSAYVAGSVRRSTDGGTRYSYADVDVPLTATDLVLFYPPFAGTPRNPANTAEAERVAFGSNRIWVSETFGGNWQAVTGALATTGDSRVRSLVFASADRLYAGLMNGEVHRIDRGAAGWTATRIDTVGAPANALGVAGPVTAIAVAGSSVYVTFGGTGDWRHVWRFDGSGWAVRSGPSAGHADSLLDIQHNAIVVDPANTSHVYVGADLGIWRSTDGGMRWAPFADGLPDAAVVDLAVHAGRRLLRAATHGRGVFERTLDTAPKAGIELFVRDTQLDQGRFGTVDFLPDPTRRGDVVRHWAGPDIKLDTPDVTGAYQFPITPGATIDFHDFVDKLTDDFQNVAVHATATITTRVYVQVHNRGVTRADGVQVMLYLANASAGLPSLPPNYDAAVRAGTPFSSPNWRHIGTQTLNDVRAGFPRVAPFDLTSNNLPPVANLAGNQHQCVLALVHHAADPFTSTQTHTDTLSLIERKAAHKNLTVVQFTGTVPPQAPAVLALQLNNASRTIRLSRLAISLGAYPGRVRLYAPPLPVDGELEGLVEGAHLDADFDDFLRWAELQLEAIEDNQNGDHPYDRDWARLQSRDIEAARDAGVMLVADGDEIAIRRLRLRRGRRHPLFLLLDLPEDGVEATAHDLDIRHLAERGEELVGGIRARVELVTPP